MRGTRTIIVALMALVISGCAAPETPPPLTPMPPAVSPDARLVPALEDLAAHPEWTAGTPFERFTITDVLPGQEFLCLELSRPGMPIAAAAVDVRTEPWRIAQVAVIDPSLPDQLVERSTGILGPDDVANAAEVCLAVVGGHEGGWPEDAAAIEVTGYQAGTPLAEALRDALFADPGAFSIDRVGTPSLSLAPRYPDGMDPIDGPDVAGCIAATVYVGGPRTHVHARYGTTADAVSIERIRVVARALQSPDPTPADGC